MSFKKINYGIIGAGHIGNFHSQQIQNIKPSVHVVGIYDINFKQAQKFTNKVADLADLEGHHPDISFGWRYSIIMLHTHAISGLSINDFIMAAKIDTID